MSLKPPIPVTFRLTEMSATCQMPLRGLHFVGAMERYAFVGKLR